MFYYLPLSPVLSKKPQLECTLEGLCQEEYTDLTCVFNYAESVGIIPPGNVEYHGGNNVIFIPIDCISLSFTWTSLKIICHQLKNCR